MSNTPNALWDSCLSLIKDNVSEQQFNAWFRPIAFESFNESGRTLILQVPSNFFVEYLEENYVGLLTKVLTKLTKILTKLTKVLTESTEILTKTSTKPV